MIKILSKFDDRQPVFHHLSQIILQITKKGIFLKILYNRGYIFWSGDLERVEVEQDIIKWGL